MTIVSQAVFKNACPDPHDNSWCRLSYCALGCGRGWLCYPAPLLLFFSTPWFPPSCLSILLTPPKSLFISYSSLPVTLQQSILSFQSSQIFSLSPRQLPVTSSLSNPEVFLQPQSSWLSWHTRNCGLIPVFRFSQELVLGLHDMLSPMSCYAVVLHQPIRILADYTSLCSAGGSLLP